MTLFDRYVVVDWSASATPTTGANSIWIAVLDTTGEPRLHNPATRSQALDLVDDLLDSNGRSLVGVDAALGYPSGTAALFGLDGVPWLATWRRIAELVTDDAANRNNRFAAAATLNAATGAPEGPFWGAPSDAFEPVLQRTKPPSFPVAEFRAVELALRRRGLHPKSCWQLLGAGSVGGQTLTLLPGLVRLLERVAVWPLTTGLRPPTADVDVVAEIWPSMFVRSAAPGWVLDAAQVAGTAEACRRADRSGDLVRWLTPSTPDAATVEREEGWILGVEGEISSG
ncbi:MAG: cobalamin biosynthesis protein CbiG [Ilumatobacter sp.]|nr:cobalamin biosynthesis protein CbiG [Ilumatobacter sp.]